MKEVKPLLPSVYSKEYNFEGPLVSEKIPPSGDRIKEPLCPGMEKWNTSGSYSYMVS